MLDSNKGPIVANKISDNYNLGRFLLFMIKTLILTSIFLQNNISKATDTSDFQKLGHKSSFITDSDQHSIVAPAKKTKALKQWRELLSDIKDLMIKQRRIKQSKAFISYAWEDTSTEEGRIANSKLQRFLEKLRDDLQAAGISVFLDIGDMHGNMKKRMEENLAVSNVILTINTPRFMERALAEPQTNLGFEYQLTLKKAEKIPYGIFPLHYAGSFEDSFGKWGEENELKELKGFLIRDCRNEENYHATLVATQRPLGIIPAIYNLDCDNDAKYNSLIQSWRWSEFSSMPPVNNNFIGRTEFLSKISMSFKDNSMQVLSGKGGIGKSEIAASYAYSRINEYGAVRQINAESGNIRLEFEKMADLFGIDNKGMSAQELASAVYEKIYGYNWLLIFDNAEDYESIKDYLPKKTRAKQHLLITSRNQHWHNCLVIDGLNDEEAFSYAKRILPDITYEESLKIGRAVEHLPLTLTQAIAYIKGAGIRVEAYLSLYQKKGVDFLNRSVENSIAGSYTNSLAKTIIISFEKLKVKSPNAARMLLICCYLDSSDIPIKLLKNKHLLKDREEIYKALIYLKSYSLVEPAKTPDSIQVNRLTQSVIREEYEKQGGSSLLMLSELAEALISCCPWNKATKSDFEKIRFLLPHMQSVLNHIESSTKNAQEKYNLIAHTKGRLLNNMAQIYANIRNYEKAKKLYNIALQILKKHYGKSNEEIAKILYNLSYVDEALGNNDLALKEAIEAHKIMASKKNQDAPSYAERAKKLKTNSYKLTEKSQKVF